MDFSKKTQKELIALCKERGIKGYSGKSKAGLVALLNPKPISESHATSPVTESNLHLLEECLKLHSMKKVCETLNLCVGTVRRWQQLADVPHQYTFDLLKILGRTIVYADYSSATKDQFFTPASLAKRCWETFQKIVPLSLDDYTFIEPSAGDGSFLKVLPPGSIGLDIEPRGDGIQCQDFLTWFPDTAKKYIVFGNPPFGLRGHVALHFINHAYAFADYVCFILPQLFESDGKGSPRKRVKGYNLIYSETLTDMFYTPEKQDVRINGVFQIWSKHSSNPQYELKSYSQDAMKVYSLSDGGTVATTRNKNMIGKCDIYLPSTCFGKENMRVYGRFEDLPGKKGYGVVFTKDKGPNVKKAKDKDWATVSFLSTNSALNLRTSMIFEQFED